MKALRTPDDRFADLPGYPWPPRYLEDILPGARMHYLDEGPTDAPQTYLCLHGQPTWSYLYRKMVPVFLADGGRVVAPDLLGFGRSDKPTAEATYSFALHRESLLAMLARLDLHNITLVCQDWGGLLGLTLPMAQPERFSRLLVMNTTLAVGTDPGDAFRQWLAFVAANPDLSVSSLMRRSAPGLSEAELAAYDAPFPDVRYKAGARTFPFLVPTHPDDPGAALAREAVAWWKSAWQGESFMAVGVQDPLLGPGPMRWLRSVIRGCPEPMLIEDAGHFVQEAGERIARAALDAWR